MELIEMSKCTKHHLFFELLSNGDYQAIDTWCGHKINKKIWYCSKECRDKGIEGTPKGYVYTDDEPIMND